METEAPTPAAGDDGGRTEGPAPARSIGLVALAFPLAGALFTVAKLLLDAFHPFALDYGEGIALDRAAALAHGGVLYTPVDRPPFITWNFPPLYAWLCGWLAAIFGPSFTVGRLLSLAATLAAAACIYALSRHERADRRWAALGACLFLGTYPVGVWGALMRVDNVGLALGLAGLVAVSAGAPMLVAGALLALGLLCKQSLFAAPAAALLYLLVARRRRDALVLAAGLAGVLLGIIGWQAAASEGLIWRHLIYSNMTSWQPSQWAQQTGQFLCRHGVLLGLVGVGAWCRRGSRPLSLGHAYLITAAAASLLVGKWGSSVNYFLDLAAALAIVAAADGPYVAGALCRRMRPGAGEIAVAALLVANTLWATRIPEAAGRSRARYLRVAKPVLANASGPVISDDPGLVVATGKPLWLQPFEFAQMSAAGTWDQTPLLRALRRGEVSLIAVHFNPWNGRSRDGVGTWEGGTFTDEAVAAMRECYEPAYRCGPLLILTARRAPERQRSGGEQGEKMSTKAEGEQR